MARIHLIGHCQFIGIYTDNPDEFIIGGVHACNEYTSLEKTKETDSTIK